MKLLKTILALIIFFCGGLDLYVWTAQKANESGHQQPRYWIRASDEIQVHPKKGQLWIVRSLLPSSSKREIVEAQRSQFVTTSGCVCAIQCGTVTKV
jgi:hypothetical protein